jgi:hypothetical protein
MNKLFSLALALVAFAFAPVSQAAETSVDPPRINQKTAIPQSFATLTYGATNDINFAGATFKLLVLTSNSVFTASNVTAGREVVIRLQCSNGSVGSTFTFPSWKFVNAAAPTGIAAAKVATLRLTAFGTAATNIQAQFFAEP